MNGPLKTQEPDNKDWAGLYQAAREYQQAAPWEWINSEELFAVENPLNGEMGYCSVLGAGGQEYGLGIYMGEAGFSGFRQLVTGDIEPEEFFEKINFPIFSMLLVDRRTLQKKDLEIIRSLNLQFRGKNAWPLIRSVMPGYGPWFLNKDEAVYLSAVFKQALNVADRISRKELKLTLNETQNTILTRCYREGKWTDERRQPQLTATAQPPPIEEIGAVREAQLLLMRNSAGVLKGDWELDMFVVPGPVKSDSGRPFYPICILAVDKSQGLIQNTQLIEPGLSPGQKQDQLIQILKNAKPLPRTIWIKSNAIKALLKPITDSLGISLRVGKIPMLEEAREALVRHFSN